MNDLLFIIKDKNGNVSYQTDSLNDVAQTLRAPELLKVNKGDELEMAMVSKFYKVQFGDKLYIHQGCSFGINQPDTFIYMEVQ